MRPQTFTPERFFQLSPAQVSLNFSPARGIERNVHTSLPVWMSHARTSPAGPVRRILLRPAAGDDRFL